MASKICWNCEVEKPASGFSKHSGRSDGLQSLCRDCDSQAKRTRRQNPAKRKKKNEALRKYSAKRHKEDPAYVMKRRLRRRLNHAVNNDIGSARSCLTLFGKTKQELRLYLYSHHDFGMDSAAGYVRHPPQPQYAPDPLTVAQTAYIVEQRCGLLSLDHSVPLDAFDLGIPTDDDGNELFQMSFKRHAGHKPAPLPVPWARVAFSFHNTRRMFSVMNMAKGTTTKVEPAIARELLLEKYLRTNPYV